MDTQARAFEYEIAHLSERTQDAHTVLEKQRLYARVGQFLMGSFEGHWWCRYPSLMVFMMRLLELYPATDSVRVFYEKMATQLGLCCKCVDIYHASLPGVRIELEYEFTQSSIKAFFCKLSQLDAERIHGVFTLKSLDPSDGAIMGNFAQTSRAEKEKIATTMSTAMYEVLSQRRLFSDFRIVRVISKWLSSAPPDVKELLNFEQLRYCPGVYQLLVSPDAGIRAWGISLIQKFGVIDLSSESGQDQPFLKVLDEWMYILESASFNVSVLSLDLQSTEELPLFLEPTNCIKTPTNQTLWAALDTIMQQMDETSLEVMLESFDNLPDLVFNYLNEADPATTNQQITFVHCQLPSWRVYVTKQLVELLPPLLASSRPPQISSKQSNRLKLDFYLRTRERLLLFLIDVKHIPAHFSDPVLKIASSKAISTIICDCYEPRLQAVTKESGKKDQSRDDGALPESQLIDYSVSESAFWWPCGLNASPSGVELEQLWSHSLFHIIVNPDNVAALVDHAAITCSTILSKHLLLARDVVFTCFIRGDEGVTQKKMEEMTKFKPIVTLLLGKLCAWKAIATIPVTVHGALFESIGGISEIMNVIDAQPNPCEEIVSFKAVLKQYELHLMSYLERICDEVLVKGLTNPLRFPVVAQHTTLCLLNPSSAVDQSIKRLLAHVAAAKNVPAKQQSILESFLISVHRNTEAFLRGVLSFLQSQRLFDFHLVIAVPTLKKIIFIWAKVFEMLGTSLQKILEDTSASGSEVSASTGPSGGVDSSHVKLQKLPILINDFLVSLLTNLYNPGKKASQQLQQVDESILVRILDFAVTFWVFWTEVMKDKNAATKRSAGLITPLVRCMENGSAAEKPRAAELLMIVLETLLRGSVALDDSMLQTVESIKSVSLGIASKRSTDFSRMAGKFRQLEKSTGWFGRKKATTISHWRTSRDSDRTSASTSSALASSSPTAWQSALRAQKTRKNAVEEIDLTSTSGSIGSSRAITSSRPMSGKAAARAHAKMTVNLTGVGDVYSDSSARKNHSFYTESDYVASRTREPSPAAAAVAEKGAKSKGSSFSISQVVKGISHVHGGSGHSSSSARADDRLAQKQAAEAAAAAEKEEEAQDEALQFAGLFHRIKNTQKPIPVCSLLPFYRQLLQLCMPLLLTRQFENERSDKVLSSPDLSFKKSSEYVNAYLPLLLEECNNELQEGLRKCYSGGGGHLLRYESEKPREGMRCLNFTIAEVDENATTSSFAFKSHFGNRGTPKDKVFRNGDVVLMRIVGGGNQHSGFMGNREFIGIILISEVEKGKKRVTLNKKPDADEEEAVKVLFLNDGELDSVTEEVGSFSVETLSAGAIADSEWKVHCIANLVTSAREYISLRSVDMLPEHLRTTILTPNVYKSTQTELILITNALDELRNAKADDADAKVIKLLKRLDKMDVTLMDLRSTSIGKAINKLRKHENKDVKALSNDLKDKWTRLMNKADALERAPRFLSTDLWDAIKAQYNQSQLQSVHSVLNNYNVGISLLQGPPGTGKTKTIMGLLSGFLALQPPALAIMPTTSSASSNSSLKPTTNSSTTTTTGPISSVSSKSAPGEFNNFQLAREIGSASAQPSPVARPTFSLSAVTSAMGSILRRTDADTSAPKKTTIQALKSVTSVRSRLEDKLSGARKPAFPSGGSSLVVRQRVVSSGPLRKRSNNVLLCAPSNGAVDELVLRIVTDGLMDSTGKITKVRAPSVHPEALNDDWLSIVRLGNPGEDAPDIVKSVCLPQIIKRELDIHPKSLQLRALQDTQQTLRKSIRDFHQKAKEAAEASEAPKSRKGLAQAHAQLTKCSGEVRRLRDEVFALRTKMTAAILSRASIIACTLSKSGSGPLSGLQRGFDALIIDEAAQAVELSTLVPIRERVARVVLVGDPKQLPATVKSVVAANARYDRSLFERIAESGVAPSMLRVQYRMHPFLRDFPSKRFYGGMLTDGPSVMERVQKVCPGVYKFPCFQPFLLYDVTNSSEEDMNGSKYNRVEAQFCIDLCQNMFSMCTDVRKNNWSVGFVSPYKEQVRVLRREINKSNIPGSVSIEVNTVDGFQGREKDVIIFSCVRASKRGGIGFLKDIRRLNVAITRARFCLFVVGHVNTLVRDETWSALVRSADDRKLIVCTRGENFPGVARRLESDESKKLVEHFKEMHEKVSKKQFTVSTTPAPGTASLPATPTESPAKKESSTSDGVVKDEPSTLVPKASSEFPATTSAKSPDTKQSLSDEHKVSPSHQGRTSVTGSSPFGGVTPSDHSRSAKTTIKAEAHPEARANSTTTTTGDHESPKSGDREYSHSRYSDSSRGSNSYRGERGNHRDFDSQRKREYSDRRRDDDWSKRPRHEASGDSKYSPRDASSSNGPNHSSSYWRDEQQAYDSRTPTQIQTTRNSRTTAASDPVVPLKSISAKEFCMENEPPPKKPGDRGAGRSNTAATHDNQHRHSKRPREDGQRATGSQHHQQQRQNLFPPGHKYHAREQRSLGNNTQHHSPASVSPHLSNHQDASRNRPSGGSGYRSVSITTSGTTSSANHPHQRPPSGRAPSPGGSSIGSSSSRPPSALRSSGGVLGNILGSASRLASATSRVQDKTVDRSREFQ